MSAVTELWSERLRLLDQRRVNGVDDGWYGALEHRMLRFFVRRHGAEHLQSAKPLDPASAARSMHVQMDHDVRNGLNRTGDASLAGSTRSFRSDDELAAMDEENQRRLKFRRSMAARVSFMSMLFMVVVIFLASAAVILRMYGR